jgi:protoporphyrinogen oxidase
MEYFCFIDDDLWLKSDPELIKLAKEELLKINLMPKVKLVDSFVVRVPYAYPVYSGSYKADMALLKKFIGKIENLQVIGRCGMYKYNNMDHSMLTGIYAARNILNDKKIYDLWDVNADEEYLEDK